MPQTPTLDTESLHRKYLEERDKRLRSEGVAQYVGVEGRFAQYDDDPYVEPGFRRDPVSEDVDAVVVGGGFSGLLASNSLLRQGVTNIRVIERGGDFGGTWYWNRYPGCRCDVESYSYLPLIEDFGSMPSEKYIAQPEILAHARKVAREAGLYDKALFQTGVSEITWDEESSRWIVRTDRKDTLRARFVALAAGILHRPKLPGIPGIESFKGHAFHTARWDYDYTGGNENGNLAKLRDKRVAIIGTGASAAQAIPHLGAAAKHLYVVQRTPASVDERGNRLTDPQWWKGLEKGWWERRARNFDGFLWGVPQTEDLIQDGWTVTWNRLWEGTRAGATVSEEEMKRVRQKVDYEKMEAVRARIERIVKDRATAEALKPWFNWMCKRPLFVDGYYETFNRPNVTLIDTQGKNLDRVTPDGIVFAGKEYPVDCIIYASGFEVAAPADRTGGFTLHGRGGKTLADAWQGGMRTLHGMFVHDFPNLGIINGLKQAGITWNITFMMRKQSEHLAAVIRKCLDEGIGSFNARPDSEQRWLQSLKEKGGGQDEFLRECTPGYYNNEGKQQGESIWVAAYGGGPFEYMDIINDWRERRFKEDLDLRPLEADRPSTARAAR